MSNEIGNIVIVTEDLTNKGIKEVFYCSTCNNWKPIVPNSGICSKCCEQLEKGWDDMGVPFVPLED